MSVAELVSDDLRDAPKPSSSKGERVKQDDASPPIAALSDEPAVPVAAATPVAASSAEVGGGLRLGKVSPVWRAAVAGGLIGAAAGVAGMIAFASVNPPLDKRVGPLAERLVALETKLLQMEGAQGVLNNEMAQAIEFDGTVRERFETQAQEMAALEQRATELIDGEKLAMGLGSPFFGVAVSQLRAAVETGGGFETELITLYTLANEDPAVLPVLEQLAGPAREGVPTVTALRRDLGAAALAAGMPAGEPSYYEAGLSAVSQYMGVSARSHETEAAATALRTADQHLLDGNVSAALDSLSTLEPAMVEALLPWFAAAREHLSITKVVAGLAELNAGALRENMQRTAP